MNDYIFKRDFLSFRLFSSIQCGFYFAYFFYIVWTIDIFSFYSLTWQKDAMLKEVRDRSHDEFSAFLKFILVSIKSKVCVVLIVSLNSCRYRWSVRSEFQIHYFFHYDYFIFLFINIITVKNNKNYYLNGQI